MFNKKEFLITLAIGFAFLCFQTSYDTILNVQEFIFRSVQSEDPSFTVIGYYASACIFLVSSSMCIFAPTITNKFGPRITIILGGIFQLMFNLQFLYLNVYLIYFGSIMRAAANALAWTAQGRYLSQNSQQDTIIRNSGIFFFFIHGNRILGNTYILLRFKEEYFYYADRMEFFGVMAGICFTAIVIFAILPIALYNEPVHVNLKQSMLSTWNHTINRDSLALLMLYFYHGMQYSFFAGTYSNCVGFTMALPKSPMVRMALSGMFTGCGGITAGIFFMITGKKIKRRGFFMIGAFFLQIINIILVVLNLPNSCPVSKTFDEAIIPSNIYVALLCSFLFGFSDVTMFTLAYSLFLFIFKNKIAEAHAIYRITGYCATAAQFFYTPVIGMYAVVGILLCIYFFTVVSYNLIELKYILLERKAEEEDNEKKLGETTKKVNE